ncbi:MAG: FHA domain-containing protein [Acidimicrobiales bacterium]
MHEGSTSGYGLAVVSIDVSSARLVPTPGADGWLCRLPGAVVWLPGANRDAGELIPACLAAGSPAELLGSVGSRLADPNAAPWPPFAVLAARGGGLVAVVHGPVEVAVEQEGRQSTLTGGDDVGSWLHRLLREVSVVRAGRPADDEGYADLRDGLVRAGGFVLVAASPGQGGRARAKSGSLLGQAVPGQPVPGPGYRPEDHSPGASQAGVLGTDVTVADEPIVIEPSSGAGAVPAGQRMEAARFGSFDNVPTIAAAVPLGKLTWDNGEVHDLSGAVLVGRDVDNDESVLTGRLMALVPTGQNDSMSRVHAELTPHSGEVVVVDRGSTNGTFVWDEASKAWQRLVSGEPRTLSSGAVLAFGERTATFEGVAAPVR